jgi:hypothetical protein
MESFSLNFGMSPEEVLAALGETTYDVYLNDGAYWMNVPARVWEYTSGGYRVVKKWLSYREERVLGCGPCGGWSRTSGLRGPHRLVELLARPPAPVRSPVGVQQVLELLRHVYIIQVTRNRAV